VALGLLKLLEFTNYINSSYPTIKFELVDSEKSLSVLDLTLHLKEGFIATDIYAKPTDCHFICHFLAHTQSIAKEQSLLEMVSGLIEIVL
jgi:hypothetical protein